MRTARLALILLLLGPNLQAADVLIPAGAARVDITPTNAVPLMGYLARAKFPAATNAAQRLHARALALGAGADASVLLTIDNCILPTQVGEQLRTRLQAKASVAPERVALTCTHTHSGPCLHRAAPNIFSRDLTTEEQERIETYTSRLVDQLEQASLAALADRKPARLAWGQGQAGFARNRRTAGGPVDHDLPMLRITDPAGKLRAIFVSYACHCTTLGGEFNQHHGDWAGSAAEYFEQDHPGSVALVAIGCGADANPEPRGSLELAQLHGREIATESHTLLFQHLDPLTNAPVCSLRTIPLPFQARFTRAQLESRATNSGIVGYHARKWLARLDHGEQLPAALPYPVQTWRFGDRLAMVFLGGEVVVDYSLRLKRELDSQRLWVNAYANDVPCYIPSRRILSEGGYEAVESLWYYDRPQQLAPEIEDQIVTTVKEMLPTSWRTDPKQAALPPPSSPEAALRSFRIRPGLEIELVASEPLIESPVAIDFAADGRLWVCEMRDYPSGMDGQGKPGGRIKVLTDTDGDGRYDQAKLVADNLPFPTGLMAEHDSVIVGAAPNVWSFREGSIVRSTPDSEGELLTGFATHNFQARVNGFRWGLDGGIYGSGGIFGGKITVLPSSDKPVQVDCSGRDFRLGGNLYEDPSEDLGSQFNELMFEPLAGVSQQGRVRDDFDNWFGNDNSTLLWHFPLPDRYTRRNPHVAPPEPRAMLNRDDNRVFPASKTLTRFNDPHMANQLTSVCGPEIYRDTLLGDQFYGNAFVCEPVHNLIRRSVLTREGVTFGARRAPDEQRSEFLASRDNWFRPVEVRTGPDGALWVVDMYRFVLEHPRWIPPDRLKDLDVRAGADKGRIYRVFPAGQKPRPIRNLKSLTAEQLADVIASPNGVERDLASRELRELDESTLTPKGRQRAVSKRLTAILTGDPKPASRAQALATLALLGPFEEPLSERLLDRALADSHPEVLRLAIRSAQTLKGGVRRTASSRLLALKDNPDPAVRFQLALTLGKLAGKPATKTLEEMSPSLIADPWLRAALLSSSSNHAAAILSRILAVPVAAPGRNEAIRGLIATAAASTDRKELEATLIAAAPPAAYSGGPAELAVLASLMEAFNRHSVDWQSLADHGSTKTGAAVRRIRDAGNYAHEVVSKPDADEPTRLAGITLLGQLASQSTDDQRVLADLLQPATPARVQTAALTALRRQTAPAVADQLLAGWGQRSPALRLELIAALLTREPWTRSLLSAVESGAVAPAEISPAQRQQLLKHSDTAIQTHASRLLTAPGSDRAAVLKQFEPATTLSGDSGRGGAMFDRLCATCHFVRGHGHAVGPDLAPFRSKPPTDFLVAILDPNAAIEPRYASYTVDAKDGRSLSGILGSETATSVTLAQPGGLRETLLRSEVTRLTAASTSLMPEGLEQGLTPQDLSDLVAWLKSSPAPFGSATGEQADAARARFVAGSPSAFTAPQSSNEALDYRSWLGSLPLFYCRQNAGQNRLSWQSIGTAGPSGDIVRFRWPASMGLVSQPSGRFTLRVNGRPVIEFDVSLEDRQWSGTDGHTRLGYAVQENNAEDSCGLLELELPAASVKAGELTRFEVEASASNSQRWFGIYHVPGVN